MENEWLDEDGYPTEAALDRITNWDYNDPKGWFEFIENIWYLCPWGWTEGPFKYNEWDEQNKYLYRISTAGWSGNEGIIRAMQKNHILWDDAWLESRRGGHYIFELNNE